MTRLFFPVQSVTFMWHVGRSKLLTVGLLKYQLENKYEKEKDAECWHLCYLMLFFLGFSFWLLVLLTMFDLIKKKIICLCTLF